MAQGLFQVPSVQHDAEHAELQGIRQVAILRSVSVQIISILK